MTTNGSERVEKLVINDTRKSKVESTKKKTKG